MRRWTRAGIAALLAAAMLTGCGPSPSPGGTTVDEDLDVYGAKDTAQAMERELAAFIPEGNVASAEQLEEGGLMSCGEEGTFQWYGHNYVYLKGEIDSEPIVDAVAEEFSDRDSYSATRDTTDDGAPRVQVLGPNGAGWLMGLSVDRTYMQILSFSPCFRLADGLDPRDKY